MKTSETIIGSVPYRLFRLDPITGARVATRVATALAPALGDLDTVQSLIDTFKAKPAEQSTGEAAAAMFSAPKLMAALAGGVAKVDADAIFDLGMQCVRGNLFADVKLASDDAFNAHFAEHEQNMLPVLVWAIRENCAGFFGLRGRA